MFKEITKKKFLIIVAVIIVYTIVGALIFSNISQTRDATPEEIAYYRGFLTDWRAIPGVDTALSEKDIILSFCTLKGQDTDQSTPPSSSTAASGAKSGATDSTQSTEKQETVEYTSETLQEHLYRFASELAVSVTDGVLVLAYMDSEDHYVLIAYNDDGISELVIHNQKEDVCYFQQGDVAQVVTNFSFSISLGARY